MDTKLIIVTGMSGAGKSTTSKSLARQYHLNGIRHRWLHEEARNHPIRNGEFSIGALDSEAEMERNIEDMYRRWDRLVQRILRSKSVYIMEGVLFDNIIRYFFPGNYPADKVIAYYECLMQHLMPANPTVVFLHRSNVRATLESLYPMRGDWWKNLILDPTGCRYFQENGLAGEEGVYTMWEAYQALGDAAFERLPVNKIKVDTQGGEWETYVERITQTLGIDYYPPGAVAIRNPTQYCGRYAVQLGEQTESIDICYDGTYLYCQSFWPYMKLLPLGGRRFEFASFPVTLTFQPDSTGNITAVRVSGTYDWEIVGTTMQKQ